MEPPKGVPHRVYIHVGAPKTGTTFIEQVLYHHRQELANHGVLYPADYYDEHYLAAVDLQDLAFNDEHRPEAEGHWEKVAFRARGWPGISIISHDVFAGATAEHARRAIESLEPADVHIVYTARDLARQLPSHWQEDVKHGEVGSFNSWLDACLRRDDSRWNLRWFWAVEDIPDVLTRWASTLPPSNVHVVTVPPPGAERRVLWERFAQVVGLADAKLDLDVVAHPNSGLGAVEVALIRHLNQQRDESLTQREYEHIVKGAFAHEMLSGRPNKRHLMLPSDRLAIIEVLANEWREAIEKAEYDIVGSIDDLVPRADDTGPDTIDQVDDDELLEASLVSVRDLLVRIRDERQAVTKLREHDADLERKIEELSWRVSVAEWAVEEHRNLAHWERVKRTIVEIGRTNSSVGRALDVYRKTRRHRPNS